MTSQATIAELRETANARWKGNLYQILRMSKAQLESALQAGCLPEGEKKPATEKPA